MKYSSSAIVLGYRRRSKVTEREVSQQSGSELKTLIEQRAYDLFVESGYMHGNHLQHWLAAEREFLGRTNGLATHTEPQGPSTVVAWTPVKRKQASRKTA